MRSFWTPSPASLCSFAPAMNGAHPFQVGLLAVQSNATGGLLVERPRNTKADVRLQRQALGVYGTSVPVVQGSGIDVTAPAATKASGVPPRGRPV